MPNSGCGILWSFSRGVKPDQMRNLPLPRNRLGWVIAGAAVIIVLGLVTSQAFSASMTVTSQPLQNAGDGDLTYTSDWSAAGTPGGPASVSLIPTGDSGTKLDKPTSNQGTSAKLEVKVQAPNKIGRSFLQFDVSSIPTDATVDSASLTLCTTKGGAAGRNYDVHRIAGTWTELGITHANQPTINPTATDTIVTLSTIDCNQVWTVTPDVAAWVGGTATNNGLRVSDQDETSTTQVKQTYNSREAGGGVEPKLDVNYTTIGYTMRHESTDLTVDVSDQVTGVTIQGNKVSHTGTINITVDLVDASATIVDQATATLPTVSGPYSEFIDMAPGGTVAYSGIVKVRVIYAN